MMQKLTDMKGEIKLTYLNVSKSFSVIDKQKLKRISGSM